ncbi:VOC family protein [Klebsiella sp. Z2]|uniref:VOC family protein n=1 Tax=Klebsiella sp. Z2 TaxID=2561928 RepID=UPI0011DF7AC6|nr:VOC family protein [Klebsiella sp. Z2]TYC83086.1 hypothetical protein E4M18_004140 [Klebsiella sp. Z2]
MRELINTIAHIGYQVSDLTRSLAFYEPLGFQRQQRFSKPSPQGTIAIGVIAKEKEHIDVLKEIASIFSDELIANALSLISDKHDFLKILQHNALPH